MQRNYSGNRTKALAGQVFAKEVRSMTFRCNQPVVRNGDVDSGSISREPFCVMVWIFLELWKTYKNCKNFVSVGKMPA